MSLDSKFAGKMINIMNIIFSIFISIFFMSNSLNVSVCEVQISFTLQTAHFAPHIVFFFTGTMYVLSVRLRGH